MFTKKQLKFYMSFKKFFNLNKFIFNYLGYLKEFKWSFKDLNKFYFSDVRLFLEIMSNFNFDKKDFEIVDKINNKYEKNGSILTLKEDQDGTFDYMLNVNFGHKSLYVSIVEKNFFGSKVLKRFLKNSLFYCFFFDFFIHGYTKKENEEEVLFLSFEIRDNSFFLVEALRKSIKENTSFNKLLIDDFNKNCLKLEEFKDSFEEAIF